MIVTLVIWVILLLSKISWKRETERPALKKKWPEDCVYTFELLLLPVLGLEGNISFVVDSGYCRNSSSVEVLRIRGCCCIVVHCSATNPKKKSGIYTVFSKAQKTPYRSRLDPKGWIKGGVSVATFFKTKCSLLKWAGLCLRSKKLRMHDMRNSHNIQGSRSSLHITERS